LEGEIDPKASLGTRKAVPVFPVITVSGGAYERGRQYGVQARDRVHRSITAYAQLFEYFAGWDWLRATAEAERFLPAIKDFGTQYVDELAGIADGADVALTDILAINVRTEIMFSARVRTAIAQAAPAECSAFATVASDGHVIAGQNWDWAPFARDTVVVLQAVPDDSPAFVTVVEAGLLAKFGVNSDGLAVITNALACTEDKGDAAVPYHVMLRALLDCGTTQEALMCLEQAPRASSANYLLADRTGAMVDVEARPGGPARLHTLERDDRGPLLHTNHFISPDFAAVDYTDLVATTSKFRLGRLAETANQAGGQSDLAMFAAALSDHTNEPDSVCRHPDPTLPAPEQSMTVASALIDLTDGRVSASEGPPCERGYEELDCSLLTLANRVVPPLA
jgi:isopenicillin-N N-acyltransferase-like protein